jgi:hypothetical protein
LFVGPHFGAGFAWVAAVPGRAHSGSFEHPALRSAGLPVTMWQSGSCCHPGGQSHGGSGRGPRQRSAWAPHDQ